MMASEPGALCRQRLLSLFKEWKANEHPDFVSALSATWSSVSLTSVWHHWTYSGAEVDGGAAPSTKRLSPTHGQAPGVSKKPQDCIKYYGAALL